MVTPEMINAGLQVVGGIANVTVDFINKLKAKQDSTVQAVKDEATAAKNILLAWQKIFEDSFNEVTTGTSLLPYNFIKECFAYIKDNPIVYTDKGDKIGGLEKYELEFKKVGTNWNCELLKYENGNALVIKTKTFQDAAIFNNGSKAFAVGKPYIDGTTVVLPYNYATDAANAGFNMELYNRAYGYINGTGQRLTAAEIAQYKTPTTEMAGQNTPATTANQQNTPVAKKDKTGLYIGIGIGSIVLLGLALLGGKKTKA